MRSVGVIVVVGGVGVFGGLEKGELNEICLFVWESASR
jgi:hypothetical protein